LTTSASLRAELDRARDRLDRAIARLAGSDFPRPIAPGGWSVHEVLIHIAVWDKVGIRTVDELALATPPTRYIKEVDRFNAEAVRREITDGQSPDETLTLLARNRAGLLRSLDAAPADAWFERQSATGGEAVSIADLLTTWTAHDDEHAAELEAFLARGNGE
jgi:hypothetical protein